MTLQDLKTLFRKYVKVVTGGPTGLTRGAGMLTVLDTLAEEIHNLPQPDDLLKKANDWQQVQTFEKGIKLPLGNFIDENGHAYFRQVDVGQRHFTFGRYYSLAKDSIIQWKPDEYINQDGDGDVGLARVGPGVLEVNTGTAGQRATLRVLDVVADSAPASLNSIAKLAAGKADLVNGVVPASQLPSYVDDVLEFAQLSAFPTTGEAGKIYVALNTNKQYRWSGSGYALLSDSGLTADQLASFPAGASGTNKLVLSSVVGLLTTLKTADKTSIANAINELVAKITFAGLGLQKNGNLIGLQQSVASVALPAFENIGLVSDTDGTVVDNNDFAKGYRYSPFIALDPAGGPLTFSSGRADFCAYYDKNFAFIRKINAAGYDANSYEAGIYYMRVSYPAAQYSKQSYSLGRLAYVRGIRTSSGAFLQPNEAGEIDGSALGGPGGPGGASTFAQLGGAARDNANLAAELDAVQSLSDGRRDLVTIASNRFNDLVLERHVRLSALKLATNASSIAAQVLAEGSTAVSSPRTGSPAALLAALQADIDGLASWDYYIIRWQTTPSVSTDVTHVLLTIVA